MRGQAEPEPQNNHASIAELSSSISATFFHHTVVNRVCISAILCHTTSFPCATWVSGGAFSAHAASRRDSRNRVYREMHLSCAFKGEDPGSCRCHLPLDGLAKKWDTKDEPSFPVLQFRFNSNISRASTSMHTLNIINPTTDICSEHLPWPL